MKRLWSAALLAIFLCTAPLNAQAEELLIPVGEVIGLQLLDDTVTVAAYDDVYGWAAREAGLKIGDQLLKIDEIRVTCAEDVRAALERCGGSARVTVCRGGKNQTLTVTPAGTGKDARLGVYLRQGIAGIGTVTFYDPDSGTFGTLGHGVSDSRGELLRMRSGSAYPVRIQSVKKGKCGEPGQLKGTAEGADALAKLEKNTPQGVFGTTSQGWKGEPLPVAEPEEIHPGTAAIRCAVTGQVQEYSVEILKVYSKDRSDGRNLLLKITDPTLLEATGGIVQGMSGSPIIQDSKLVGAVTHVLVNDPTTGYGIFIENMLEAAG